MRSVKYAAYRFLTCRLPRLFLLVDRLIGRRLRLRLVFELASDVFLPLLPMNNLSIGATCCIVDTNFWTLPIVARTPSMPPMRSTIDFRSLRLERLNGKPPFVAFVASTTCTCEGSAVEFMAAGGPENELSIPGNGSCPKPEFQPFREDESGSLMESHPFLVTVYVVVNNRAWTDARVRDILTL